MSTKHISKATNEEIDVIEKTMIACGKKMNNVIPERGRGKNLRNN